MNTLIVCASQSGFTLKYAQLLKEELGESCFIADIKKFKPKMLGAYDRVVFMAPVINNTIAGFKTVTKKADLFASKFVTVVAVGMSEDSAGHYHLLEQANVPYSLKGVPLFYLKGGFDFEKLTGKNKLMINFMRSRLVGAQSRSPEEMAMLKFLAAKSDFVRKENLSQLLAFLKSGEFNPPAEPQDFVAPAMWVDLKPFMPQIGSDKLS